jgi:hypothetical protein
MEPVELDLDPAGGSTDRPSPEPVSTVCGTSLCEMSFNLSPCAAETHGPEINLLWAIRG